MWLYTESHRSWWVLLVFCLFCEVASLFLTDKDTVFNHFSAPIDWNTERLPDLTQCKQCMTLCSCCIISSQPFSSGWFNDQRKRLRKTKLTLRNDPHISFSKVIVKAENFTLFWCGFSVTVSSTPVVHKLHSNTTVETHFQVKVLLCEIWKTI